MKANAAESQRTLSAGWYWRENVATVELTLEQLREAIIQLPETQRQRLLEEIQCTATANEARRLARELQGTFRMNVEQRARMSKLLDKGNEGTLSASESRELNALVDEFEQRTLQMARTLAKSGKPA
jgi:hypothetical protein